MATSNFNKNITSTSPIITDKNEEYGYYTFVDRYGNVTQINKKKKTYKKYYPNRVSKIETIIGDEVVIGLGEVDTMGIGDNLEAYAEYI